MAAVDEEGSQSENKNDDPNDKSKGKPFSTMHQEIENKLVKPGISYEDRVGIILSGWDHLAGTASTGQLPFATFLYKWTLQLVLQGEWPKLEKIVKTRLKATLQRCTRDEMMQPMCSTLLPLVTDPWGHQTLKAIIAGSYVSDEEGKQYIQEETWPVVRMRVNTLVESRCEELALSVLKVCMRCLRLGSNLTESLLNSQEDHNHFVDLYYLLMYKFQRKVFLEEVKRMDILEGVDHVRRLLAQQEKGRIWKSRLKAADLEIQIFLTSCIVKPFESVFSNVFSEWCNVMREVEVASDVLVQMVRKYIQLSESSQHIYSMGSILHHKFGEVHAALVTELLIRALTFDMNALEGVKLQSKEENMEEQTRLEHQMAEGFMHLSTVFGQHESVARECVLTAFSLHPTPSRLQELKNFGLITDNSDKLNVKSESNYEAENVKEETFEDEKVLCHENDPVHDNMNESLKSNSATMRERCNERSAEPPDIEILDTGQQSLELVCSSSNENNSNSPFLSSSTQISKNNETQCNQSVLGFGERRNSVIYSLPGSEETKLPLDLVSCSDSNTESSSKPDSKHSIWEFVDESSEDQVKRAQSIPQVEETKVKEDVDSMDGFLATTERLIKQLNQGKETDTQTHEDATKEEDTKPPNFDILTDPQAVLNQEKLGLSKELCDDLAVVLSSPRWQVLSWMLEKHKLLATCEKYMKDVDSAKNVTKELKYLNIDYSQFQHLPSAEVDEFTGIEKGYEHFIEKESDIDDDDSYSLSGIHTFSSGSENDCGKRIRGLFGRRGRRGRPSVKGRYSNSDSDSAGRSKSRSRAATSYSESDDSEFESASNSIGKDDKEFEGKRVTAISSYDRRKRLRIDATTGRFKRSHGKRSNVNHLRLYRHHQGTSLIGNKNSFLTTTTTTSSNNSNNYCSYSSRPGATNINSKVVLNHYDRSSIHNRIQDPLENEVPSKNVSSSFESKANNNNAFSPKEGKPPLQYQRNIYNGNWRYAGYVISKPQKDNSNLTSSLPVNTQTDTVRCSYRTREGRLVTLNTHNYLDDEKSGNVEYLRKLGNPSSKFEESFAKFLLQQKSGLKEKSTPSVTITKKAFPLEKSFEYLKRQGTSVIFKKSNNNNTNALATAQKNVLDRIMSPEITRHSLVGRSPNQQLPVNAIAMPISHNPPNLPPSDKTNPAGLSRVLPKGTTVVRRPKIDSGAGPSGLNNGGTASVISRSPVRTVGTQPRPAISITPSNFLGAGTVTSFSNTLPMRNSMTQIPTSLTSNFNPLEGPSTPFSGSTPTQTENDNFSPLASATVVGSVSQTLSPRLNSNSSPGETQGSCYVSLSSNRNVPLSNLSQASLCTTTTTVATMSGETRAPSMLETLLRDRSTSSSPLIMPLPTSESTSHSTPSSVSDSVISSPSTTRSSLTSTNLSEAFSLATTHSTIANSSLDTSASVPCTGNEVLSNVSDTVVATTLASNINLGVSSIPVVGSSLPTSVLSASLPANVISSGVSSHASVSAGGTSAVDPQPAGMHQLLLPAQLIQVQGSDGSTGLGIVHSGSLDLRLPPGTRVIKSSTSNMRPSPPVAISQSPASRPLNVLHNVKIVQNRQIVRTVVVPHSVALQSLGGQQTAQLVALNQTPGTSNSGLIDSQTASKISSSQLQKMLGHNIVPGGLVIRAVRPPPSESSEESTVSKPPPPSIIQHTSDVQQQCTEKDKESEKPKAIHFQTAQEEGLAERLNRHYLKTALLASTSTQSVGTQTQTTAVKPVTGQLVNQVVMNHLRGIGTNSATSVPIGATSVVTNSVTSGLSPLSLNSPNAVSSETLEQLREFESVFEKVSNKSVKENESTSSTQASFPPPSISSEESMIAAQLLSMANDTSSTTASSSYVYTLPSASDSGIVTLSSSGASSTITSSTVGGARIGEGTFITIPNSSQGGTLILVNPSAASSGTLTSNAQTTQPPPAASPALSSTSSHSSVASSPSSTSSKSKSKGSKPKVTTPPSAPVTPTKPKSPPPPKAPPKPTVAKPQVEESDETKARIQAILDRYKQDLANTPQPQPAPRNRKNCPPPKNEGKSSSKKKNQIKKPDGTANTSPCTSESGGHLTNVSHSPAPLAATPASGDDSEGSVGGASVTSPHFQSQEEKKSDETVSSSPILQGVVVSNVKVDNSALGNNLPAIPQGRVVQLIRHGSKVTAITTKQPYQKSKAGLASGGPPPNVTIQGRINMSELMESHLASLLAGGSSAINQSSALITKLIQAQQQQQQQQQATPVQQVVVHTSGGMGQQVIQQVSLQPVITSQAKSQHVQNLTPSSVSTEDSSQNINSPLKTSLQAQPSPAMSVSVSPSPGTPQQRASSPSTPSPAPELPSTPSSFPTAGEESNSSVDSNDGGPSAPLPPFFTLTKQFMTPPQNQQFSEKSCESTTPVSLSSDSTRSTKLPVGGGSSNNSPSNLTTTKAARSSFIRSSFNKVGMNCLTSQGNTKAIPGAVILTQSAPPSPVVVASGDTVLDMSPVSGPSSLESSPSLLSHRLPLVTTSELRSNSLDSVKSDLSVEEVQIPPSPATLTKQLQNAYMTEAALSPTVSHSHLSSNSSYSSPTTVQDIHSAAGEPTRVIFPTFGHTSYTYSLAGQSSSASSLSNNSTCSTTHNNPSMENHTLNCLSSPSGDVYLDQAGVGLGLDSLPLEEGRPQSPSLSDLVPAVPLLSWSPRSADSIMGQSPSLNEALTGNMTLDVHHSEDSLCDSSTGFPGLFAMDGDAVSASSSSSDDILNSAANPVPPDSSSSSNTSSVISISMSQSQFHNPVTVSHTSYGKRLPNHDQNHAVSSTRSENVVGSLLSNLEPHQNEAVSNETELLKQDDSTSSTIHDDDAWKFEPLNKRSSSNPDVSGFSDEHEDSRSGFKNDSRSRGQSVHRSSPTQSMKPQHRVSTENLNGKNKKDFEVGFKKKRNTFRPCKDIDNTSSKIMGEEDQIVHNGFEKLDDEKDIEDDEKHEEFQNVEAKVKKQSSLDCPDQSNCLSNSIKPESLDDDDKPVNNIDLDLKRETKSEDDGSRQTRGSKRRSDSDAVQEEKRSRSSRSRRSDALSDLSPEEGKPSVLDDIGVGGPLTRSLRGRHVSGTSDTSSNYSVDRVSTPGPQDSPVETNNGGSRRRKRRGSHDSSVSSRDGSPLTLLLNSQQQDGSGSLAGAMHTRRSSSRDHAKKTRCRCCVDQSSSGGSSGRRSSGRVSRGSGPNSSTS